MVDGSCEKQNLGFKMNLLTVLFVLLLGLKLTGVTISWLVVVSPLIVLVLCYVGLYLILFKSK